MKKVLFAAVAVAFVWVFAAPTYAAVTTEFTQNIGTGTLSVTILDHTEAVVGAPAVPLASVNTHALCNTTDATGALGTNTQRVYVDNPGAANNGWGLAVAATDGPTATWSDGGSNTYDFNDAGGGGCTDGADGDSVAGQLTIDATGASLTLACSGVCTSTGVSMGTQASFVEGSVNSISLATAASGSDDIWRGYLTAIDVLQTIPASQPAGNYTIDMTLTVTAI